jgi:hypothetical protein
MLLKFVNRKVVGWTLSADMEAEHTAIVALEIAYQNRVLRRTQCSICMCQLQPPPKNQGARFQGSNRLQLSEGFIAAAFWNIFVRDLAGFQLFAFAVSMSVYNSQEL